MTDVYESMLALEISLTRRKLRQAQKQHSEGELQKILEEGTRKIDKLEHHLSQVLNEPAIETEAELTRRTGRPPVYDKRIGNVLKRHQDPLGRCRALQRHLRKLVSDFDHHPPDMKLVRQYRRAILATKTELENAAAENIAALVGTSTIDAPRGVATTDRDARRPSTPDNRPTFPVRITGFWS
jgi:hypothetical protein